MFFCLLNLSIRYIARRVLCSGNSKGGVGSRELKPGCDHHKIIHFGYLVEWGILMIKMMSNYIKMTFFARIF